MAEGKKKILIVDDEDTVQLLFKRYVTAAGYDAITASSGVEALDKAEREIPDLVLLDVMMPDMNGFALCRKLRASPKFATTPILIVTALRAQADTEDAFDSGATDFVVKPVNQDDLVRRIRKYLRA